jgi:DNA-directed RNA polymerase subunit RPC12/RpoP
MSSRKITDDNELARLRKANNPNNDPTGHFTGRCGNCGSTDLWDDTTAYGCNCCGAAFATENMLPRYVCNDCGAQFDIGQAHACPVAKRDIHSQ